MKLIEVTFELPIDSYNNNEEAYRFMRPTHVTDIIGDFEIKTRLKSDKIVKIVI